MAPVVLGPLASMGRVPAPPPLAPGSQKKRAESVQDSNGLAGGRCGLCLGLGPMSPEASASHGGLEQWPPAAPVMALGH